MLLACWQHVASMLPACCQHVVKPVVSLLLVCCQHVVSMLSACCQHVAMMCSACEEYCKSISFVRQRGLKSFQSCFVWHLHILSHCATPVSKVPAKMCCNTFSRGCCGLNWIILDWTLCKPETKYLANFLDPFSFHPLHALILEFQFAAFGC